MKRADQHNVVIPAQHPLTVDSAVISSEAAGIDKPSEKEANGLVQSPGGGALPVDTPGSIKTGTTWQSYIGDVAHIDFANEQPGNTDDIAATGAGADPENTADNF